MRIFKKITGVGRKSDQEKAAAAAAPATPPAAPPVVTSSAKKNTKKKEQQHQVKSNNAKYTRGAPSARSLMQAHDSTLSLVKGPQPDSTSGLPFEKCYRLYGVLGSGAFSTVREGKHRSNPEISYAVKCVDRDKLTEEDAIALVDEVAILREFDHEHIILLYDVFDEEDTFYLVMERMTGGELFDRIVEKAYYNEKEARDVCAILLDAVRYCHANNVAHRDLKPENLLLVSQKDDAKVKIADFGFAKRCTGPKCLKTQCGTPGYVSPEILEGVLYDTKADMWSVGVILYILLGGYPPFIEPNQRALFRKIRRGQYEFHDEYWSSVSGEAKNLIASLLTVDPSKRLTAEEALANEWITGDADELAKKGLDKNLEEFKRFNAKRKFKAAVKSVIAINKLSSLGIDFKMNLD